MEHDLEIIPVINKVDLPSADPCRVIKEVEDVLGIDGAESILCSAKTGLGIDEVLEAVVNRIPAPQGDDAARCRRSSLTPNLTRIKGSCSTCVWSMAALKRA